MLTQIIRHNSAPVFKIGLASYFILLSLSKQTTRVDTITATAIKWVIRGR